MTDNSNVTHGDLYSEVYLMSWFGRCTEKAVQNYSVGSKLKQRLSPVDVITNGQLGLEADIQEH